MVSEANKTQVGGAHYKTEYEHWDWALTVQMGPLEYAATKYVARWRKKAGLNDLKKALHYVNKIMETQDLCARYFWLRPPGDPGLAFTLEENRKFAVANDLGGVEARVCLTLATWGLPEHLYNAREMILELIKVADPDHPVPLEDSNKHADRVLSEEPPTPSGLDDYGAEERIV